MTGFGKTAAALAAGVLLLFGVVVPPSALKQGRNAVKVYEVAGGRLLAMS